MAKATSVRITPTVLKWAIRESGYTESQVAGELGVSERELRAWLTGAERPSLTHFRKLAVLLKRTPATFLLPTVPLQPTRPVDFRHPPAMRTTANADERRYLREATRLQDTVAWLTTQLGETPPRFPEYDLTTDVERAAQYLRQRLQPLRRTTLEDWRSHSQAFDAWRGALEAAGILVFLFPLGKQAARGFSLWNHRAPLVAVNTAWNEAARIFTLFHECGHLLTRTSSVCVERVGRLSRPTDPAERWCEEFAAAALLPWVDVTDLLRRRFNWRPGETITSLDVPRAIANEFKVSWRAAAIRLIERGAASWTLYKRIPPVADTKRAGGAAEGRDRGQIRVDQYGWRVINLFVRAMDRQVLGRTDVLDYLDVPDAALDRLHVATTVD